MSIILKGIDLPIEGEQHRIIVRHNGQVILCREVCYEKGEAIQIPKGHGRIIDEKKIDIPSTSVDIFENCRNCNLLDDEQVKEIIANAPTILEAEEQDGNKRIVSER